jgi:ankyrin repeat protein
MSYGSPDIGVSGWSATAASPTLARIVRKQPSEEQNRSERRRRRGARTFNQVAATVKEELERESVRTGTIGNYDIWTAARENEIDIVRDLVLKMHIPVDSLDLEEKSPLLCAAGQGHVEVIRFLREKGANIDHQQRNGYTALHWACFSGQFETVKQLLEFGCNIDAANSAGCTPLYLAIIWGRYETCKLLVERGADVNKRNSDLETPLHWAVIHHRDKAAVLLLEAGAQLSHRDCRGHSPVDVCESPELKSILQNEDFIRGCQRKHFDLCLRIISNREQQPMHIVWRTYGYIDLLLAPGSNLRHGSDLQLVLRMLVDTFLQSVENKEPLPMGMSSAIIKALNTTCGIDHHMLKIVGEMGALAHVGFLLQEEEAREIGILFVERCCEVPANISRLATSSCLNVLQIMQKEGESRAGHLRNFILKRNPSASLCVSNAWTSSDVIYSGVFMLPFGTDFIPLDVLNAQPGAGSVFVSGCSETPYLIADTAHDEVLSSLVQQAHVEAAELKAMIDLAAPPPGKAAPHYATPAHQAQEISKREEIAMRLSAKLVFRLAKVLGMMVAAACGGLHVSLDAIDDLRTRRAETPYIGMVGTGGRELRCFMFKFLADSVHLPCSLMRNGPSACWVEIRMPQLGADQDHTTLIVDLGRAAGNLLPSTVSMTEVKIPHTPVVHHRHTHKR